MHSTMTASGMDAEGTAPHFETRLGKRRWLARTIKTRERRASKREDAEEAGTD